MKNRMIITLALILFFAFFMESRVYSADTTNDTTNAGSISGENENRYAHRFRSQSMRGIGPIIALGVSRYLGDVNYEELMGQGSSDTQHNDGIRHRFTYGFGVRYTYLESIFLGFIGYSIDVYYQRYGLEIDNANGMLGGVPYSGGQHTLSLDYVVINPTLRLNILSFGIYLGFLGKAGLSGRDVSDYFKKVDFGFTVAVDITLPFKTNSYLISIIFEGVFGAVNMLKESSRSLRNIAFNFKFAYMFAFDKKIK